MTNLSVVLLEDHIIKKHVLRILLNIHFQKSTEDKFGLQKINQGRLCVDKGRAKCNSTAVQMKNFFF